MFWAKRPIQAAGLTNAKSISSSNHHLWNDSSYSGLKRSRMRAALPAWTDQICQATKMPARPSAAPTAMPTKVNVSDGPSDS